MQRLEASCAVRHIYTSLGAKALTDRTRNLLTVAIIPDAAKTECPLITTVSTAELPYCLESQHPPGYFLTAALLRDTTEVTFCTTAQY